MKDRGNNMELSELQDIANQLRACKIKLERATKQTDFGYDLPLGRFLQIICNRTPQSYGGRIGSRIVKVELSDILRPVDSKKNRGDCRHVVTNDHYEVKTTCVNHDDRKIHFVQIRPYQDNKGYILVVINPELDVLEYKYDILYIPEQDMTDIIERRGNSAHGTKDVTLNRKDNEYRMTLKYRNKFYNDLIFNYKVKDFTTLKAVLNGSGAYENERIQHNIFDYTAVPRGLFERVE